MSASKVEPDETSVLAMVSSPKGRAHRFRLPPPYPSPASGLSDSHMLKPQRGAILDALEVVETPAHHSRAWFAVIASPTAKPTDDPASEGKRASGVRVLLPFGLAFELRRYGFEDRLIGRLASIREALAGR